MKFKEFLFGQEKHQIFMSVQNGKLDEIDKYIVSNGNLNIRENGRSLLSYAIDNCEVNYIDVINILIDKGADVNLSGGVFNDSPLHRLCARAHPNLSLLQALISHGADINAPNNLGKTPVFYILFNFSLPLLKLLSANGANILHLDNNGNTLLHDDFTFSKDTDFEPLLKALIELGLDINEKNKYNKTVLDMCKNSSIEKILISNGAMKSSEC